MAYKPNMEDIKKLRTMTGAGLADVKKALTESEGDFNKAMEIIREKGQAIAVKEAQRLGIPVFGIVDTNSNPNEVDFAIPANDDGKDSVEVILNACCGAIAEGLEERKAEKADEKAAEAQGEEAAEGKGKRGSRKARKEEAAPAAEEQSAE